jgi:glycosyltransferase involved in cell wall biosynthesis
MKHLIISREYPGAPGGGIGTYVASMSRLLAQNGETVHVIGQLWKGFEKGIEEECSGRLIIHRVPFVDWTSIVRARPHPLLRSTKAEALFKSAFPPQSFAWTAAFLAESLVAEEGIDVIEAQEFEAPLYFFQLRRNLGLGPNRRPPCIVHLHSPSEFIAWHNGWNEDLPAVSIAKRMEDYTIAAADALLCPSAFLARQAEAHYGIGRGAIPVIPYPLGNEASVLERDSEVWRKGPVTYVGRLEPRKGVLEWIDAAVDVASENDAVQFEFVGANVLGCNKIDSEDALWRRIPGRLRPNFRMWGEQERSKLNSFLAGARISVVPSRWDNFPNTCMEAMASGLPVIATRAGGMAEMIEDNRSGWLADTPDRYGLGEALRRALNTPPSWIAGMGRLSSEKIHEMCGNERVLARQLDFRKQVALRRSKQHVHPAPDLEAGAGSAVHGCEMIDELVRTGIAALRHPRRAFSLLAKIAGGAVADTIGRRLPGADLRASRAIPANFRSRSDLVERNVV